MDVACLGADEGRYGTAEEATTVQALLSSMFVRFLVKMQQDLSKSVRGVFLVPEQTKIQPADRSDPSVDRNRGTTGPGDDSIIAAIVCLVVLLRRRGTLHRRDFAGRALSHPRPSGTRRHGRSPPGDRPWRWGNRSREIPARGGGPRSAAGRSLPAKFGVEAAPGVAPQCLPGLRHRPDRRHAVHLDEQRGRRDPPPCSRASAACSPIVRSRPPANPCAGLAAAHDRGVIHRDLKLQNIMMNNRGDVVVIDL